MLKVANSVINASRITGVLPVANGGTGVTTSTGTGNTVLSASPTLSGDVNFSTGNLVIGTAGKGIDFSITSSGTGTMTSELLADYEEGTWTPTVVGTTVAGTATYATQTGTYTKVGRAVTVNVILNWNSHTGTGDIRIDGLPFVTSDFYSCTVGYSSDLAFSASNTLGARFDYIASSISPIQQPVGGGGAALVAMDAAAVIFLTGTYFV